uniref:Nad6 protein n=1 Tax=Trichinella pseudospiralis TaxID=6337 RepID=A0A0A0UZ20_TRIPS|nr:NADH dehydrogenase subunit 6 [Trichinella pseudospiralis]
MIWIMTLMIIILPLFLYLTHPLWISILVFLLSISTAIYKFYATHNNSMFGYLFVMVYSGGLLIMLTYISSLTPSTIINKLPTKFIMMMILPMFIMTMTTNFNPNNDNHNYNELNLMNMSTYLVSSPMINAVLTLLTTSFCLITSLLSQFKYPIRSL